MAEAPVKLDHYKEALRESDRRIAPENSNDFAELLVSDIDRAERLMSSVPVAPERVRQYKERIRRFIVEADSENFQKLSQDLHGQLEALYKEMETGKISDAPVGPLEPPKPDEVREQFEIPKVEVESFESHLRVGAETFNISDPNQIAPAATALQKVEMNFIDAGKKLSEKFQDVHGKVQEAQKASEDGNIIDWVGSLFSDSDEKEVADAVITEAKKVYEDSLSELGRQRIEITNATHRLTGAATNYLLRIGEGEQTVSGYRRKVDEGKTSFDSASKAAREFSERIGKERTDFDAKFQRDMAEFERQISALERRMEEIRRKRIVEEEREQKLREKRDRVEKKLARKDLDPKEREKLEHKRNFLDDEIAKFSGIYGEIDRLLSDISSEYDSFVQKRDGYKTHYETLCAQMDEQKGAREREAAEFGERKEEAERYSVQLEAFSTETAEKRKNLTELRNQMDSFFREWREGNSQMMDALNQQKSYLENAQIDKPSLFSSLWNTPVLGKWGILGIATLPLRAVPMAVSGVDDLTGGVFSRGWKGFSDAIDGWAESSKKAGGVGAVFSGIVSGTKDLGAGLYQFAAEPMKALDGLGSMIIHPERLAEMGKMLLEVDEFSQGHTGYAAGRLIPTIVLTVATSGAGAGGAAASQGAKAAGFAARMGMRARTFLAAGGEKITVSSATKAFAKGAFVDLPVGVVRGAYRVVKGTGKLLMEPFYIYRNVGRGVYGAVRGLEGRELQMFVSRGKKGLIEYRKSLQAAQEEVAARRAALEKGGSLDAAAQERLALYEKEFAQLEGEIGTASSAEAKLGIREKIPVEAKPAAAAEGAKIPAAEIDRISLEAQKIKLLKEQAANSKELKGLEKAKKEKPFKRKEELKVRQEAIEKELAEIESQLKAKPAAAEGAPAETAAKGESAAKAAEASKKNPGIKDKILEYRQKREVLNRRMETIHRMIGLEKDSQSLTRYLDELYGLEKEMRALHWQYGKEAAGAIPGVRTTVKIFAGVRAVLRKSLEIARCVSRGAVEAVKYAKDGRLKEALTAFFKAGTPEVHKFFRLIVDNWSMYPAGMREALLKTNESLFDKFVFLANRYPALSRAIAASPSVKASRLEEALRVSAEDDFTRESDEFFKKFSEQKIPEVSFTPKVPDILTPPTPSAG